MRASRATTAALLCGYPFGQHVFHFDTVASMKTSFALYDTHQMRVTQLRLPYSFNEPLLDRCTGGSLLPASLTSLWVGEEWATDSRERQKGAHKHQHEHSERQGAGAGVEQRGVDAVRREELRRRFELCRNWNVNKNNASSGAFNHSLSLGSLPRGLRSLQLNDAFNQPLMLGSIPEGVEFLQLGWHFNQQLEKGHLPSSLTTLILGNTSQHPLLPGVLPAGLQRLHLGSAVSHIHPGALPSQLKQLSFGWRHTQPIEPGLIPPSVSHIRLSDSYKLPLQPGSIPHGVVHLDVGDAYNLPLEPGVLPSSLRELVFGERFDKPLQLGSLPDGLEVLAFREPSSFRGGWRAGVIPASVVALNIGTNCRPEMVADSIPATVRWMQLPNRFRRHLTDFVTPATFVEFSED